MIKALLAAVFFAVAPLPAQVTLLGSGEIPATARDSLGDTIGGLGSAVAYDARTKSVFMMPDRGAGDGTIDYRPRCYRVEITRDGKALTAKIAETILFLAERGQPFTGLSSDQPDAPTNAGRHCLDPEAISVAPDGTLYVSDEYTPTLLQFDRTGHLLRRIPLPDWTLPRDKKGRLTYDASQKLVSGRTNNHGFEAMGILPDGRHAVLIAQSALAQDHPKSAGTSRVLVIDLASGQPTAEYGYAFTDPATLPDSRLPSEKPASLSVNDLTVIDDHTLLVLERDGLGRNGSKNPPLAEYKAIYLVSLRDATNLLTLPGTPYDQSPKNSAFLPLKPDAPIRFVKKTLLFNLPALVPQLGMSAKSLAAKWEGITQLPASEPGTFRLLMTADNDFLDPHPTFNGITTNFPRAKDAVPTQFFEILVHR